MTTVRAAGLELTLGELIERGGMADVFAALGPDGAELAVKRLLPKLAIQDDFVAMFHDEARISAQLEHPNIVRTLGSGSDGQLPCLVMERVRGPSALELVHRWRGEEPPLDEGLLIGWQIASALAYAHALPSEIVHRDVSPSNILVDRSGAAKLIDFGIARAVERLAARTRTGLLKGKDGYMSPEQCLGSRVDRRSDIFSLGIVLYELTTGLPLFRRDPVENSFAVMERVTSGRIAEEPLVRRDPRLADVVLRCLEHEPDDRFDDAGVLADALAALVEAHTGTPPDHTSPRLTYGE